jgi:hypothetical protein
MKRETVRTGAFAMPLTNPPFPPAPTGLSTANTASSSTAPIPRRCAGSPLELTEPVVNYEFIRMPDSTGFWRLHRKRPDHPGAPANPSHSLNPKEWSNVNSFRFSTDSNDAEHQQSLSLLRAHLST